MPQRKSTESDIDSIFKVSGAALTVRNIMVVICLIGSLCGTAWATGSAYTTITSNQTAILDRMSENDVCVARLAKEQAETEYRTLQLEREIIYLRKEFEQNKLVQWTKKDDELAMTKYEKSKE